MIKKDWCHYLIGFCAIGSSLAELLLGKSFESFLMMMTWCIYDEVKGGKA